MLIILFLIIIIKPCIASNTIIIYHEAPSDNIKNNNIVHYEICISKSHVQKYRSSIALLTIEHLPLSSTKSYSIVFETWCSVSNTPSSPSINTICPWRCHLPGPESTDLRIQFIKKDGVIQTTYTGKSLQSYYKIQKEKIKHVKLYTSFFISYGNNQKEEQLEVTATESLQHAAKRFAYDHHLDYKVIDEIEKSLFDTMKKKIERKNKLMKISKNYSHIIIGASESEIQSPENYGYSPNKWLLLSANDLNILDEQQWNAYFQPNTLQTILSEHVFEHLSFQEVNVASRLCLKFLMPNGILRLAVPDAYYKEENEEKKRLNDIAWNHRVLFNYRSIKYVLENVILIDGSKKEKVEEEYRFERVILLEWHTRSGFSYGRRWNPLDGFIHRSKHFDKRGAVSLIVDAVKGSAGGSGNSISTVYDLESRHHHLVVKHRVEELLNKAKSVIVNGKSVDEAIMYLNDAISLNPFHLETLRLFAECSGNQAIHTMVNMRLSRLTSGKLGR